MARMLRNRPAGPPRAQPGPSYRCIEVVNSGAHNVRRIAPLQQECPMRRVMLIFGLTLWAAGSAVIDPL